MPYTPYHFPPSVALALALRRHLDFLVFVFANVAVDLEPLAVMMFWVNYPVHGYCHTLLGGVVVGVTWGLVAYLGRPLLGISMRFLRLSYKANLPRTLLSGILGVWFHILADAFLYADIRPFWPSKANPLHGTFPARGVYAACTAMLVPALALYAAAVIAYLRKSEGRSKAREGAW